METISKINRNVYFLFSNFFFDRSCKNRLSIFRIFHIYPLDCKFEKSVINVKNVLKLALQLCNCLYRISLKKKFYIRDHFFKRKFQF